jgi:hypothetical protein
VGPGRIDADPKNLSAERAKVFDSFSELGKFVCSTRRKVKNVRQEDDRPLLEGGREAHGLLAANGQLEIGRSITGSQICHSAPIISSLLTAALGRTSV